MTHPTHKALVQELARKLRSIFTETDKGVLRVKTVVIDGVQYWRNADVEDIVEEIEEATLAAAKGAADSGKVKEISPLEAPSDDRTWNDAISQSERQLEDYFREV